MVNAVYRTQGWHLFHLVPVHDDPDLSQLVQRYRKGKSRSYEVTNIMRIFVHNREHEESRILLRG